MNVVEECYRRAHDVLRENSTDWGFKASSTRYHTIWGRDGCLSSMGSLASGDTGLWETSILTLKTLQGLQTPLGQLPNHLDVESGAVNFYATDTTAWWVIAACHYWRQSQDEGVLKDLWPAVESAITWLRYQSIDSSGLINSPPAGDWMDSSLQRCGKVFYNNVLFFRALQCATEMAEATGAKVEWKTDDIKRRLNLLFWPKAPVHEDWLPGSSTEFYNEVIDPDREFYLHYLSFESYDSRCDVAANCLAILWDVADATQAATILGYFARERLSEPHPIRVLEPTILHPDATLNSKLDLSRPRRWQNRPHSYHNGAIWPWVGGLYVMALVKVGDLGKAGEELEKLAHANRLGTQGEWEFNEWLHGQTGHPMGAAMQSWNASSYLMAYQAVTTGDLSGVI